MKRVEIENRKKQKIVVLVDEMENQKGLAFVMHGLSGFKEQPHIIIMAESFKENGYTVIRFDTTNTFGESDGDYEDATTTNYYEDLEDVIKWAGGQKWYQEPFVIAGHSLGGISTALYAENYSEKVKAVAPISTVVSGVLSVEEKKKYEPERFKKWQETGWDEEKSCSKPGVIKRLKWSHITDRLKYDLLLKVKNLKMPVLLIVGEKDKMLESQKIFYDALPGEKELHIIKGAEHTFYELNHLTELKEIFNQWIAKIK